ncbi:MAG: bifunctional diguanylate cyclase/phosphodiesterase [Gammaproteobacteria bacterium]|nr:bifunctional diguanylate cyclase/phosphodiesterase [Gammaproteobacteria bacterium]
MHPTDSSRDEVVHHLQERIEHLEQVNRWHMQALDMLASMGDMHRDASRSRTPHYIYSVTRRHLARLIDFDVTAFVGLNEEDSSFALDDCEPQSRFEEINQEVDRLIDQGKFAWVLNRNHPVVLKAGVNGSLILLHVLASKTRVRGVFVGFMAEGSKSPSSVVLNFISIVLHNCAQALESSALYNLVSAHNKGLKKIIQQRTRELEYQYGHDSLTGLPNRLLFHDRMRQAISSAARYKRMVAVMVVDLDMFKRINDTLGHESGDKLLTEEGRRLLRAMEETDLLAPHVSVTVSHLGGDEFGILLTSLGDVESIPHIAKCIIEALSMPLRINGHEIHVTSSVGISLYPADGADPETLLKNANAAMQHAKQDGGDRYLFYAEEMNSASLQQLLLENSLRHAVGNNELMLHYQPKVDICTGNISGWEALIRWRHPDIGVVLPSGFIPIAENTGLITTISEWVLHAACSQAKVWLDDGFSDICISVNLSAKQFLQKNMLELIVSILDDVKLPARHLELEITESTMMKDIEATTATLDALHKIGVRLSIDDFGTGYSSLNYLKRFPIDILKVDRSFIRDVTFNSDDAAIVTAIIAMSHSMGLKVVAEGVETSEQLDFLRSIQCEEIQGYLFSAAVPEDQAIQMMRSGKRLHHVPL